MEEISRRKGKWGNNENIKPNVWFSLKKSLHCKSEPSDVHDPRSSSSSSSRKHHKMNPSTLKRRVVRSGCSRSIANLRDVINGSSKRHIENPPICSPRSMGSSDLLNPIAHEVVLSNSRSCELKITGFGPFGNFTDGDERTLVGTLRPGTPGPGGHPTMHYYKYPTFASSSRTEKSNLVIREKEGSFVHSRKRSSLEIDSHGSSQNLACHKCGEHFIKWDSLEAHHLSNHAVTELVEGDSSRKIVEIICGTSWTKSENQNHSASIERVLKVHNTQKTIAQFEEYREMVKIKASKLSKKHPRCLADGNELLRFYGTTVACSLGLEGSSTLCDLGKCCVCRIIRHGFDSNKEFTSGVGVFTTSMSGRAFEGIKFQNYENIRRALIVCRVIAGRVHRPVENLQELAGQKGFDSLAGKVGVYSNIEELYLLNPKALLPCFVVICKP